jgi:hypothetical protein
MSSNTFIVDCPLCKAKVAAIENGRVEKTGFDDEIGEPYGHRIQVGSCPRCKSSLVGESWQLEFEGFDSDYDNWSDVARVFPDPPKTFASARIHRVVKDSLMEADRSLQANANIAACAMLGRALEALCRDVLTEDHDASPASIISKEKQGSKKPLMLAAGIKQLRDKNIIDARLFDWSQQLYAFRNLAAHPEDISISREDAGDLQTFVYAIVEYIYDLSDRYEEFKARVERREKRKKA